MVRILAITQVELVGRGALGARDLVVPLLTLIGGLAGVIIGGWFNRRTLEGVETRRDQREESLEARRDARQASREADQAQRELVGERRRAFGAARVLHAELHGRTQLIEHLRATPDDHREEALTVDLGGEDAALLAAWFSDVTWARVTEARAALAQMERARQKSTAFVIGLSSTDVHDTVTAAMTALHREVRERLTSDRGSASAILP